jgi:hypothetical protein
MKHQKRFHKVRWGFGAFGAICSAYVLAQLVQHPPLQRYVSPPLGSRQKQVELLIPYGWVANDRGYIGGAWVVDLVIRPPQTLAFLPYQLRDRLPFAHDEGAALLISYRERHEPINLFGDAGALMFPGDAPTLTAERRIADRDGRSQFVVTYSRSNRTAFDATQNTILQSARFRY